MGEPRRGTALTAAVGGPNNRVRRVQFSGRPQTLGQQQETGSGTGCLLDGARVVEVRCGEVRPEQGHHCQLQPSALAPTGQPNRELSQQQQSRTMETSSSYGTSLDFIAS